MNKQVSRWYEHFAKWQPKIMLHGIKVEPSYDGLGGEDFIIPHIMDLLELSAMNKDCWEFIWDANDEKWSCVRVSGPLMCAPFCKHCGHPKLSHYTDKAYCPKGWGLAETTFEVPL